MIVYINIAFPLASGRQRSVRVRRSQFDDKFKARRRKARRAVGVEK
jgi:hypothetical protein